MEGIDQRARLEDQFLQSLLIDLANHIQSLQEDQRRPIQAAFERITEFLGNAGYYSFAEPASEAAHLLEAVFAADPGGLAIVTIPDLIIRMANTAFRKVTTDPGRNPVGHLVTEVWPQGIGADPASIDKLFSIQETFLAHYKCQYADGISRDFTTHHVPIAWHGFAAVLLVNWETTRLEEVFSEVEQREKLLRQSESHYRQLLETAYEGIWTIDAQGNTDFINERGAKILGYSPAEMLGKPALSFHTPADLNHAVRNLEEKKHGLSGTSEYRMRHKSGEEIWISSSTSPILDEQGQYTGALAMFTDITVRKQDEQSARAIEVQRRLLEHRELERQEIARNIHDGPVQTLVGLLFSLKAAREVTQSPSYLTLLEQVTGGIRDAVQELREVVNEMRPPALLNYGLSRAIQIHSEDLRARHPELKVELDLVDDENLLPEGKCLALYRIYQEGLNNILRHSGASQVYIRYYPTGARMVLELRDNGSGFEVPADWVEFARGNHFGVAGMRERVEAVGGELHITSQPGQGTTLQVRVPIA